MLEVLNILLFIPMLLGDTPGDRIIAIVCFVEFLFIVWLFFYSFFSGGNRKNDNQVILKLKEKTRSLMSKIESVEKEKGDIEKERDNYKLQLEDKKKKNEGLEEQIEDLRYELSKALTKSGKVNPQPTGESSPVPPSSLPEPESPQKKHEEGRQPDSPIKEDKGDKDDKRIDPKKQETKVIAVRKILYASSYSREKRTFSEISPVPTENTIYVMSFTTKSDSFAELNVFSGVTEKIINCRDYLEFCCDAIGDGNDIKIEKPGSVVLEDGNWIVKDKIIVKFI